MDAFHSVNSKIKGHPYASKYKLFYWIQYIQLYLVARVFNSRLKHKWVNNIHFFVDVNDWAFARNCYLRLNEFHQSCFAVHYLKEDDLFIDAGANLGHFTLLVGAISESSVISFEPDIDTFAKLKSNIDLNKLKKNVRIQNLGLGDRNQKVSFKSMRNNGHNYILNSEVGDKEVEIIPLDKVKLKNIPSLIKIDVEGYEKKVLIGAENILKNKKLNAMIIEISDHSERYGNSIQDTYDFVLSFGFNSYEYNPFLRQVNPCTLENRSMEDIIFIRDLKRAKSRLSEGKPINLDDNYSV